MSIIIVKKTATEIVIGSDSQETSEESSQENVHNAKLREVEKGIFIAGAGDGHVCSLLYSYAESKNSLSHVSCSMDLVEYFTEFLGWIGSIFELFPDRPNGAMVSQFILVIHGRVWQFNNFYVREIGINDVAAIGGGAQSAMACMQLTNSVEEALNAVCMTDIYCSTPLNIITIPTNE